MPHIDTGQTTHRSCLSTWRGHILTVQIVTGSDMTTKSESSLVGKLSGQSIAAATSDPACEKYLL